MKAEFKIIGCESGIYCIVKLINGARAGRLIIAAPNPWEALEIARQALA